MHRCELTGFQWFSFLATLDVETLGLISQCKFYGFILSFYKYLLAKVCIWNTKILFKQFSIKVLWGVTRCDRLLLVETLFPLIDGLYKLNGNSFHSRNYYVCTYNWYFILCYLFSSIYLNRDCLIVNSCLVFIPFYCTWGVWLVAKLQPLPV